ncbi:MAG: HAMP domain-containing sensor histidine kinase [Pseudoxanthomonas sp.]
MRRNTGLKRRILYWLVLYTVLLSAVVTFAGASIHERVEHLAWESLLRSELDYFDQRSHDNPGYLWNDTDNLRMFGAGGAPPVPAFIAKRKRGLHDDVVVDGKQSAVLVEQLKGRQVALALDLTEFEGVEDKITASAVVIIIGVIVALALLVMWGLGRVIEPLAAMARQIAGLQPEKAGQRVFADARASTEMVVIADAFNDYLMRNESFVQREHAFIATSSHELRTPIAVIAGAAELALAHPDIPAVTRNQVLRIQRTARNVEQLISLLLVLVKDPSRLGAVSERVVLDQLLPGIVEDHRHLSQDKNLTLILEPMPSCEIVAPEAIVQAAIGNLLRNAIENSDRGEIRISLQADATVVIDDPGHGMSPEEISAIYARLARGGGRDGGGIGLDLISRLCEHLGWRLVFSSVPGRGTRTTLHLG